MDPGLPLLSVVVPVSNMAGQLNKLSSWMFEAKAFPIQIVVVHDFRDVDTRRELANLKNSLNSRNFTFLEGRFGNPGDTRNHGFEQVRGVWTVFWDSDDCPNLKGVLAAIHGASTNVDVLIGGYQIENSGEIISTHPISGKNLDSEVAMNPGLWRFILRTEKIANIKFPSLRMAEDQVYVSMLPMESIKVLPDIIYTYSRSNPNQLTKSKLATRDLRFAVDEFAKILHTQTGKLNSRLIYRMIARQSVTSLKRLGPKDSLYIFIRISKILSANLSSPKKLIYAYTWLFHGLVIGKKTQRRKNRKVYFIPNGGLGNQFFQLSAALNLESSQVIALASLGNGRRNRSNLLDMSGNIHSQNVIIEENLRGSNLLKKVANLGLRIGISFNHKFTFSSVFFCAYSFVSSIIFSIALKKPIKVIFGKGVGYFPIKSTQKNILLIGYFQSFRWATSINNGQNPLSSKARDRDPILEKYRKVINDKRVLVVHLRLGDFKVEQNFGVLSSDYYRRAIQLATAQANYDTIWLFSDEPDEALRKLPDVRHIPVIPIVENSLSPAQLIEIMSMAHGYVIANSTFSWWGAFFSISNDKKVYFPTPWFKESESPMELTPPNWTPITAAYEKWNQ